MVNETTKLQMLLQKIRQYPRSIQQEILQIYLLYALRHDSPDDIKAFCQSLLLRLETEEIPLSTVSLGDAIGHQIHDEIKIKQRINKRLEKMIKKTCDEDHGATDVYDNILILEKFCDEIESRIRTIAEKTKKSEGVGIYDMLDKITVDTTTHDDAMLHTAQLLFDRIFESINPAMAESYIDQSVLQVGPLKKAAMFDAIIDKYNQLLEYHQNGKFIRDYKVTYKRYLRKSSN